MITTVLELSKLEIYHADIKPANIILKKFNDLNINDNAVHL